MESYAGFTPYPLFHKKINHLYFYFYAHIFVLWLQGSLTIADVTGVTHLKHNSRSFNQSEAFLPSNTTYVVSL